MMLLNKDELLKKANHYSELAAKAGHNYQTTGLSRYGRDRDNYEDLADVYRAASAASDDHNAVLSLRSELLTFASKFDKVITGERIDLLDLLQVAKELISYVVITCSYKRIETSDGEGVK